MDLKQSIRTIPDFPKPGVMFRDVTTLFADPVAFRVTINRLVGALEPHDPTMVAGIEARGFILGGALAKALGAGFLSVRKAGKLPGETHTQSYELEYGQATLEVHVDGAKPGAKVVVVDDLIATGGTALATIELIRRLGGEASAFAAVIDLPALGGAEKIRAAGVPVETLLTYE